MRQFLLPPLWNPPHNGESPDLPVLFTESFKQQQMHGILTVRMGSHAPDSSYIPYHYLKMHGGKPSKSARTVGSSHHRIQNHLRVMAGPNVSCCWTGDFVIGRINRQIFIRESSVCTPCLDRHNVGISAGRSFQYPR